LLLPSLDYVVRTVLTSKYKRRDRAGAAQDEPETPAADEAKEVEL